jgi:hypothetical protein
MAYNNRDFISAIRGYLRLGSFPLDASTVYPTLAEAEAYAWYNPTAYPGQVVSVVNEVSQTVTVYKIDYMRSPSSDGLNKAYRLSPVYGPDEEGTILTDNVFHYNNEVEADQTLNDILNFLLRLLSNNPLSSYPEGHTINKLRVDSLQISGDNDVITKGYLDSKIMMNTIGVMKTIQVVCTPNGGVSDAAIPPFSKIKKITIDVDPAYGSNVQMSIYLARLIGDPGVLTLEEAPIVESGDIIQDVSTLTFVDMNLMTNQYEYYIVARVTPQGNTVGRAEILVDYLDSPIRDNDEEDYVTVDPNLLDAGSFVNTVTTETIDGGDFDEPQTETLDGGNF